MIKDIQNVGVVILAAGKGKRMGGKLPLPKVLYPLAGKPMLQYIVESLDKSRINTRPVIVIAPDLFLVRDTLGGNCDYAVQDTQLGTGHAVLSALPKLRIKEHTLVLYGDHPLITTEFIDFFVEKHLEANATLTMATIRLNDFDGWRTAFSNFSRIIRDENGQVERIVEVKDADEDALKIREVLPGFFCFKTAWLDEVLPTLSRNNAQGEYYLTDLVAIAIKQGKIVADFELQDGREALGINTAEQLEYAETILHELARSPQQQLL